MESNAVGVIVARFQVPQLHAGHRSLIDRVLALHHDCLIVLGTSPTRSSDRNPLDYKTRAMMVHAAYPNVRVANLRDWHSDSYWSMMLDALIEREFPGRPATLYGSRHSCLGLYSGRFMRQELPAVTDTSGTEMRNGVKPRQSKAFRQGMIYASHQRFPTSYQTVDVAVLNENGDHVLLGMKQDESQWRFIGGFIDPKDESLERAAKREVIEETNWIETDDYRYLGSYRIADWRYPVNGTDAILTAFFAAKFIFGAPQATDDLARLSWEPIDGLAERVVPEHRPLAKRLTEYLARERTESHA